MRNWMKYLIVTLIVALLTNGGQFYLWNQYIAQVKVGYETEIEVLNATIQDIGTLVDVYSVRAATFPGQEVKQEDLMLVQTPESLINDSYVLEPQQVMDKFYKIAISPGTPLTDDMFMSEALDDTTRETDLIADSWSVGLKKGDYVDLEITYPYGDKYVVLSHIRVENVNANTIKTYLTGSQRHIYNGALVDYFLHVDNGASLNLVKYTEPGIQEPSKVTYSVTDNILSVITEDPNVMEKINTTLNQEKRTMITNSLSTISDEDASALSSGRRGTLSDITGAEKEHTQMVNELEETRQKELEKQQREAAANQQSNNSNLSIQEGVVN
ncbi:SAF domain-containing protein [Vallitalea pronyensis]|uniref:SAF domain-containing protein n=1 Tax=Vallitalea pronyensis TaxID=1348613 RepID=A0A8J8MNP8_9FIRM|nr:SAF domain-containing protein [Vallitalea pronyensis]QUI25095.1 SAF domain-containing protein [Vallitalea pronyensis]